MRYPVSFLVIVILLSFQGTVLIAGELVDSPDYLVYLPSPLKAGQRYPLVAAFSPGSDARSMLAVWKDSADRYGWIVCASKAFHNGELSVQLPVAKSMIERVVLNYPVDVNKIIATGFSGGAMVSHLLACVYPYLVNAVVANTGMINLGFRDASTYPKGKLAVFIASPTDFRYSQMKEDKEFLDRLGWKTEWLEFTGGHRVASDETYRSAATWIQSQWGQ